MHAVLPAQAMHKTLQNWEHTRITPILLHTQELSDLYEGHIMFNKGVNFKMSLISIAHLLTVRACVKYFTYYIPT
jgi:hypothetical protein